MKARNTAKFHIMTALVVVVFSLLLAVGVVYAKYIKSVEFSGNVTISAGLAEKFELFEHKAVRGDDGGYTLDTTVETDTNSYILMPGVDVAKDPQIRIKNKTAIDAYLYVEVIDGLGDNGVSYTIDENYWEPLGIAGRNIYVYVVDGEPAAIDETFGENGTGTVKILLNNEITVNYTLDRTETDDIALTFHAYMAETVTDKTAAEVFTMNFNSGS